MLYLDTLGRCLDDGELSYEEQVQPASAARAFQLSKVHRVDFHRRYYDRPVRQIPVDGVVTEEERTIRCRTGSRW